MALRVWRNHIICLFKWPVAVQAGMDGHCTSVYADNITIPRSFFTSTQADAVLKVTSTAICGSDLHLYLKGIQGMFKGKYGCA